MKECFKNIKKILAICWGMQVAVTAAGGEVKKSTNGAHIGIANDIEINENGLNPKFADYECFLTLKENLNDKKLLNFYTLLKKTKRKKIFVGPKKLKKVTTMLGIDNFVEVPIINAFSDYDRVMDELAHIGVNDNNIYILCCSMMSCLICSDLKEINKKITLLDVGSGLDPIFGERTRPKQPSEEECVKYFKNLLPKDHTFQKKKNAVKLLNNISSDF